MDGCTIVLGRPGRHHVGGVAAIQRVQATRQQSGQLEEQAHVPQYPLQLEVSKRASALVQVRTSRRQRSKKKIFMVCLTIVRMFQSLEASVYKLEIHESKVATRNGERLA